MSDILETNNYIFTTEQNFDDLEFLKKKVEILEKDLFKSQTQIKKLETQLKKSQDLMSQNNKNSNNTSISFFLPSEFKEQWETLVKGILLEVFENIWEHPIWLAHITQDLYRIVYNETLEVIKDIVFRILEILNIKKDESNFEKFLPKFRIIFQDNFNLIFHFDNQLHEKILVKIKETILEYKDFSLQEGFNEDIMNKSFRTLLESLYKLCIYMILHDPILKLNIVPYNERNLEYFFFNKNDYLCIEGFAKADPCLVIINSPVLRNKFPYHGIKPSVYILQNPCEDVLNICRKNQELLEKIKSEKNSRDFSNSEIFEKKNQNLNLTQDKLSNEKNTCNEYASTQTELAIKPNSHQNSNNNILSGNLNTNSFVEIKNFNKVDKCSNTFQEKFDNNSSNIQLKANIQHTYEENSPFLINENFSQDILSISFLGEIDKTDSLTKNEEVLKIKNQKLFDHPLKKVVLNSKSKQYQRTNSHKKINNDFYENMKLSSILSSKNLKGKNNLNSARIKTNNEDAINYAHYNNTTNYNETNNDENTVKNSNSFIINKPKKKNEKSSIYTNLNLQDFKKDFNIYSPRTFSCNRRKKNIHTNVNNNLNTYLVSEDGNFKSNKSKGQQVFQKSYDRREIQEIYKSEYEMNCELDKIFSSAFKLKLENINKKNTPKEKNFSPKINLTKPQKKGSLEFKKSEINEIVSSKVNFTGSTLNLVESQIIFSPKKYSELTMVSSPFSPKSSKTSNSRKEHETLKTSNSKEKFKILNYFQNFKGKDDIVKNKEKKEPKPCPFNNKFKNEQKLTKISKYTSNATMKKIDKSPLDNISKVKNDKSSIQQMN